MEKWFAASSTEIYGVILSAIGIYIAVILFTQIFGKRSFSKMSSFDFAMTVAIGSIIASSILAPSPSLILGAVGLFAIYALQLGAAFLRRYNFFERIIDNSPLLLMEGKNMLKENMLKARVTESDLRSKLREANVTQLSQVKAVVFEATGDISVLHSEANEDLEEWLMKEVKR